ncbi:MAG: RNA helicase [Spirochaetes bacterium GWF1_51_8]|nr:MAG: RNA helicase [Spirochaetes bacterium GWF1_51_8]
MNDLQSFRNLGLSENSILALGNKGFEEPTDIQEKVIPIALNGTKDIVGQAQTGTGKTAAFGLPILEKIEPGQGYVQALVLCPTRELAIQVSEEIHSLRGQKNFHILPIYGGSSIEQQLRRLKSGVDIVVGTPGRVIDHINRKSLNLSKISYMVLDEADEMLNMGFIEDTEKIISHTNDKRRMLLFSATMPDAILDLARRHMRDYEFIRIQKKQLTVETTDQIYFEVAEGDKFEALCRIMDVEQEFYGLIFCRTKVDVDEVTNKLVDRGYEADALHGDVSQYQRERIMEKFKGQRLNILVATDVAARGIDVNNLTHVINYSLPQDPESYVHRIGRTGRAGKEGTAITFVTSDEYRKLLYIQRIARADIRKEDLPGIDQVIEQKRSRIKEDVHELLGSNEIEIYRTFAKELLETADPESLVSAILRYSFQDELDPANYNEIRKVSIDKKGKSRLFVALGRNKGMNAKKVVDFIEKEAGVKAQRIHDVRVLEEFSFITVSFEDAEVILNSFRKNNHGNRPLVEKAKDSNPPAGKRKHY